MATRPAPASAPAPHTATGKADPAPDPGVHRRTVWFRDPDGSPYRARRYFPAGPSGATILLAGPADVSLLDGTGPDDRLLRRLTHRLVGAGGQVLTCDMPPGPADGDRNGETALRVRTARLEALLRAHRHLPPTPVVLLGFSLGGRALLRLLESGRPRRTDRVVLVGTVPAGECFVDSRVGSVDLVYGGLDLITGHPEDAHLPGRDRDRDGSRDGRTGPAHPTPVDSAPVGPVPVGPEIYGEWSAGRLIGREPLRVRVHRLEGLGHTLHPGTTGPVRDPVAVLTVLAAPHP